MFQGSMASRLLWAGASCDGHQLKFHRFSFSFGKLDSHWDHANFYQEFCCQLTFFCVFEERMSSFPRVKKPKQTSTTDVSGRAPISLGLCFWSQGCGSAIVFGWLWAASILKLRAVFLCCWRIGLVCLALELVGPCVVLDFSVGMEAFDELLSINVPWSQEFPGDRVWT